MVRGVLPILLLLGFAAETTAQTLYPRIISVRTRNNEDWCELETESCVNTEQAVSCYKSKAMPVPIPVPIGGRLYLRLHATHNSAASVIAHNIENLMYGYPGEKDKTTFFGQGGLFSFAPSLSHAGNTYEVCAETTATRISVSEKLYTCIKLEVRTHRVQFVAPTPAHASSFTTTVGRHFEIPLHADTLIPGGCNSSNYTYQCANTRNGISCPVIRNDSSCDFNSCPLQITSSNSFQCSGCTCMTECPLGPLPRVRTRPDLSYPLSNNGLPDKGSLSLAKTLPNGTDVTSDTRAQPWVFSWRPSYSQRSHVPSKICFEAWADMGIKLAEENSETRCYSILVSKCRQCVQTGDTLQSIALQHNTDWLHIYHANPSLPGSNPSHVKSGYVLRLGVQYDTRWGDNMQILSERFLVPQSTLLDQNPELISATTVAYSQEEVPGEYTQVTRVLAGQSQLVVYILLLACFDIVIVACGCQRHSICVVVSYGFMAMPSAHIGSTRWISSALRTVMTSSCVRRFLSCCGLGGECCLVNILQCPLK
jgi:hypothetical protein